MTDKMREEFEAWAAKEGLPVLFLQSCGFYDARATELTWQAWQASRAESIVELPDFFVQGINAAMYRDDIIKALDEAGVKYNG